MNSSAKPARAVRLEATSVCQLRCPTCPTAEKKTLPTLGRGHLSAESFRRFLSANPNVVDVELSNWGELFLNPELREIIDVAFAASVRLRADNGVNFNHVTPEILDALVERRFHSLSCSLDGASEESYARYRVGGSFARVLDNVRALVERKRAAQSAFPRLTWQFVVFGHNQHEIAEARRLAGELDMHFRLKLNWGDFSPARDEARELLPLGVASRSEFARVYQRRYLDHACLQLWNHPQINWDGKLLGCCQNYWLDFKVNVFETGLDAAMASEPIAHARKMLCGRAEPRDDVPCTTCPSYLDMRARGAWLQIPADRDGG